MQLRQPAASAPEPPKLRLVRPSAKRARGVPVVFVQLAMIFAVLAAMPLVKPVDNDFWWHLRTGDLILHGGIPRTDPFSWSKAGQPWVAHEWLSEAIIYVVQTLFGYAGNVALFSAVLVSAMVIMFRLGRAAGAGTKPLVALTLLSALVLGLFVTPRPQLFTFLLFAVFVSLIAGEEESPSRRVWLLPPLMALWANLHLGFTYGLAVVGCWLAARIYERLRGHDVDVRTPALVLLACAGAASLNPHGPALLWFPLRYVFNNSTTASYVAEWHRPGIGNPFHTAIFVSAALLVAALLSRTRPRPFLLLVTLLFVVLSMQALRNAAFAALLLTPVVGGTMARRWRVARAGADSALRMSPVTAVALPMLTVALVIPVVANISGVVGVISPPQAGYPQAAVAYVRAHDAGRRLLNEYGVGGYEIAQLYPGTKVFIDGRSEFYGDAFLRDYLTLTNARPGWRTLLAKYDPQVILLPPKTPLVERLRSDAGWRVAFTSADAVVLEQLAPAASAR
ncbi:MAG: ABC transporter permease [Dehalococcoidia bacterium]|nr:ABC transporter permease [Dehalococcoidia bacterium]